MAVHGGKLICAESSVPWASRALEARTCMVSSQQKRIAKTKPVLLPRLFGRRPSGITNSSARDEKQLVCQYGAALGGIQEVASAPLISAAMASAGGDKYRSFMHGEGEANTVWRLGAPPNYDIVNKLFEDERTHVWPEGSLEEKVQRLLKTWEMELVHKLRPEDQKTVHSQKFCSSTNGLPLKSRAEIAVIGGYNMFLQTTLPPEHRIYDPDKETLESGMATFLTAFPRGFAIEVLDVFSGPPKVAFKFRHWGYMEGPFKDHPPHGQRVEFFGICIFHVDEEMKVEKAEYFYERGNFLASFLSAPAAAASGSGCPVMRGN